MKKIKKITAVFLAFLMIISAVPLAGIDLLPKASALEPSGQLSDKISYTFDESTGTLTISGTGAMSYYVRNKSPFYKNASIINVIIEDGITKVGSYTFDFCENLINVTLPDGITGLGREAFGHCYSLVNIRIPDSVKYIGDDTFSYCQSLTSIIIPDSVTSIGDWAFYACSALISIVIPDSVTSIGEYAFESCDSLKSVIIPDSVTNIGSYAFAYCKSLTSITIPDSVTSIDNGAFDDCYRLTNITIPDGVISIGERAFNGCYGVESMTVDENNPVYDSRDNCNAIIETATNTLVAGCKNTIFPDSVTSIGNYAFGDCDSLTSIVIPDSITNIGEHAFESCVRLTSVVIPDSVTSISNNAFRFCNRLESITIPDGVTSIGHGAFYDCLCLKSVIIPESVTSIENSAFMDCTDLKDVYVNWKKDIPEINYSTFAVYVAAPPKTTLHVPKGMKAIYEAEGDWGNFKNIIDDMPNEEITDGRVYLNKTVYYILDKETGTLTINGTGDMPDYSGLEDSPFYKDDSIINVIIENGVTSIGNYAFGDCDSLTSIVIPDSITNIGEHAFEHCDSLTSIVIPDSVTSISNHAFEDCDSLTSIVIPDSVTSISNHAFEDCARLESITIPDGVTSIGEYAFYNCGKLTNVTIVDGVESIGGYAFNNCVALTDITIPGSVTSIGEYAFYNCRKLTNVTIVDGVESIGGYAFNNCVALTDITIPDSVTDIGSNAFYYCNNLESVTLSDGIKRIGSRAFCNCQNLTSMIIPESVTFIGSYVFKNCSNLTDIYVNWTEDIIEIGAYVFTTFDTTTLHVPKGTKALYEAAENWNKFENIVDDMPNEEITDNRIHLNDTVYYTFDESTGTLTISGTGDMPDYDYKNESPFYFDDSIKSVIIKNGITSIGNEVFGYCDCLTSIEIPDSVTSIGESAFECCGFENITIPDSVKSIGKSAFMGCEGLTGIAIPDGVTIIDEGVFCSCSSLTSIEIPENITSIGSYAFESCRNLENIIIPDKVTSIGNGVFYCCSSLTSIEIPDSVTSIGLGLFEGCENLTSITVDTNNHKYDSRNNCNAIIETTANTLIAGCANTVIPDGIVSISEDAFCGCGGLTSIGIPDSVTSIGDFAFVDCDSLKDVYYGGTKAQWNTIEIEDGNEDLLNANIHFFDPYAGRVDNVILSSDSETLRPGETLTLTATVLPEDAVNKNILWSSSNEDIVSVENGTVTAYGVGTAYITVETEDGGFRAVCRIKVAGIVASSGSTVIDTRKNLIYGLAPNLSSIDEFVDMTDSDAVFEYDSAVLGTGSVVNIVKGGEVIDSYEIVVFGDTDGDAWYDGADSVIVNCIANGLLTEEQTGSAVYTAADCNHDGVVDSFDVEILERAGLILSNVDQTKSAEELAEDSVYAEYLNLISQTTVEEAVVEEAPVEGTPEVKPAEKTFIQKIIQFIMTVFDFIVSFFNV